MGSKPNNSPKIIAAIPAFNAERYIGSIVLKTRRYVDYRFRFLFVNVDKGNFVAQLSQAGCHDNADIARTYYGKLSFSPRFFIKVVKVLDGLCQAIA